ncbi:MAG: F0F1 ATP synthase subunit A [Chloroflexi bacterium]|nr:F0F1 ATP synthase subunit A [Chloroflexota bacterium]MDK1045936.1 F0F1 ATP synthase subunit A [Anaerolineales bacterium]MCI0773764.1 F0F1 ATP synthase subunit A [Chloroflexota bacterium]MCI0806614.1 F0F1 ATP synthase subunit A [Chloroflexota bacterium]MCI0827684.1 F0F1 ATP synthase subunit A [Chloroflexota bacterium]
MEAEKKSRWRWGVNRWIVLVLIVLNFIFARQFPPIAPHVQLPAEPIFPITLPVVGEFVVTNTIIATLIADVVLFVLAFFVWRSIRRGNQILTGITGVVEALTDALFSLSESTAGKWGKSIFVWMATIVFLVLIVNWTELIPGVDSVGLFEADHIARPEECTFDSFYIGSLEIVSVGGEPACSAGVIPFVRVASTDLNFTIALAIISVGATQMIGIRALGVSYFTKFFNTKTLFTAPMFGVINFLVSLLEAILEFAKILSFGFRLFGNIFAGSILLFVVGTLAPVFLQSGVLLFEWFVGIIQAIVFGLLTLIFMSLATVSHSEEEGH